MTMSSPARRHQARIRAAQAAASVAPGKTLAGTRQYELMLAKLAVDKRRLKSLQSVARKIDVKREVLPEYVDYVAGVLEGGRGAQDDVIATVMIWRIDAGDYAGALDIARYALRHAMTLPEHYERALPAAVAEEFAEAALRAFSTGEIFPVDFLQEVDELTRSYDMHDQIRAKLQKALGYALEKSDPVRALEMFRRAVDLHDRVGVKKDITRLENELRSATAKKAGRT
ncbi:phage terminase small subunit [Caballeronia sp. LZ032]|uniref:phage terminase small subunit n=1 Tax=Caballeronia sp. LZ032 TaxID=3038565 RepID=UPI002866E329|nr:phage terminase small subunit [Caballeronia sp. LZ032]MDR5883601.1 phage terminase small subunit [Caballeronia sp. LZ032]